MEKLYEDFPENIKSDLSAYKLAKDSLKICEKKDFNIDPETKSIYNDVLKCCVLAICEKKSET